MLDSHAWLEVKPEGHAPTGGEIRVAWQLVEATGKPVYIVAGWPQPARLAMSVFAPGYQGSQTAMNRLAMVWLAYALNRGLLEVHTASRAVMSRRMEFVRMWRESHGKEF